ncbi:MAG: DUF4124 domain-containing protein [Pseudomonadales bacterium]|nr:DUF4124 domain-containing protein [Pseudomonadales bacterium]
MKIYGVLVNLALMFLVVNVQAADVYRCKSESGGVVFQQKACNDDQVSGNSSQHIAWRKLRVMTSEGLSILSSLGADVPSIKACKVKMKDYRHRLDDLKPLMTKIVYSHPHLAKSYGYLYECSVCKTSAEAFCRSSNASLREAMKTLVEF